MSVEATEIHPSGTLLGELQSVVCDLLIAPMADALGPLAAGLVEDFGLTRAEAVRVLLGLVSDSARAMQAGVAA